MKVRLVKEDINTKTYFDKFYADSTWKAGYGGALPRLKFVVDREERHLRHLDIACADGCFTNFYLDVYPDTKGYGIDIATSVIKQAKDNCPQGHFVQGTAYKMPYKDNFFDFVHCGEMLEHLANPELAISEAYRVLKPGGIYVVTVPNEKAADYIEHLWRWDENGVQQMLTAKVKPKSRDAFICLEIFTIPESSILYAKCQKPHH